MTKLFEKENEIVIDTGDLPPEDPSMLGDMRFSLDTVKHLNHLADLVADTNNRAAALVDIHEGVDVITENNDITADTANLAYMAIESLMGTNYLIGRYPSLESFTGDFNTIPTSYMMESIVNNVADLHAEYSDKFKTLLAKAERFHKEVLTKIGRMEKHANDLLAKVNNVQGHPKATSITLRPKIGMLINTHNNVGSIKSMISVLHSGHYARGSSLAWENKLKILKSHDISDREGVQSINRELGNPIDDLVKELTKNDFTVVSDDSNTDSGSGTVILRSNHGLMGNVFMTITIQHSKRKYVTSSTLGFVNDNKLHVIDKDVTLHALTVNEQREILKAIIELCHTVRESGKEIDLTEAKVKKLSEELSVIYNTLSNDNTEIKHLDSYQNVRNYIYTLFNSMWLIVGPANLIADNSMKVAMALLIYVEKSLANIENIYDY